MARRVLREKPPELAPHECPVELTALILCRAAAPHIIRDLAPGAKTFTELRATIVEAGASSSRTLAARLKSLEGKGYVTRTALKGYHRRVEYDLSEKGRALVPVVEAMKGFGESWLLDAGCEELPDLRPPTA